MGEAVAVCRRMPLAAHRYTPLPNRMTLRIYIYIYNIYIHNMHIVTISVYLYKLL